MFNRELKVQIVKTPKQKPDSSEEPSIRMTPEAINKMVVENVQCAAILLGIGYAAKKVIDTASEIALIAAQSNFK